MDQTPNIYQEAMQVLDGYYRAVVTKVAEEIVENRDNFDVSYTGRAEEIIDRYGMHLQSLARIYSDLMNFTDSSEGQGSLAQEAASMNEDSRSPVSPSEREITTDTPLEVGAPVLAEWSGAWWRASVLELEPDGLVRIRYAGWESQWDETVPRSRLREDVPDSA